MKTLKEINWPAVWWATKWLCGVWGAIVMVVWFAAWPGFLLALPTAILFSAIWYGFYRLRIALVSRSLRGRNAPAARREAGANRTPLAPAPPSRREQRAEFVAHAPRHPQRVYSLLENGREVAEETNKRAIENWLGLGEEFDAVAK
jgi:hypothetical protein